MIGSILASHGSEQLKKEWLPGIADGTKKIAFGLTEPDAGSNSHAVTTTATRDGEGWRLSGSKYYISAIDQADALLLVTRDAELSTAERKRLSIFVVPTDAPGLSYQKIDTSIVSPDKQFSVFLDDVYVGPETLVGQAGDGLKQVFAALNPERILVGAITTGVGRYAIEKAADYAKNRAVWDVPIGQHQGVAHPLAAAHIDVEVARLATQHAAQLYDEGDSGVAEAANIAKFVGAEAALESPRPSDPDARWQRARPRVRTVRALVRHASHAHRSREPGDGAQLRRADLSRSAAVLLKSGEQHVERL